MSARRSNANLSKSGDDTPMIKKRVTKASSPVKSKPKKEKTSISQTRTKSVKVRTKKTDSSKKEAPKKEEVPTLVHLPTDASPRLKSKAKFLHDLMDDLQVPMYRIAYVSAICFVVIGAFTVFTELIDVPQNQTAQLCTSGICADTNLVSNIESTANAVVTKDPEVQMLDLVPSLINEDVKLSFKVLNGTNVAVNLLSSASGGLYQTEVTKLSDENYRMTVPATNLPPAQYSIRIFVTRLDGTGTYSFPGGRFEVPKPLTDSITNTTNTNVLPPEKTTNSSSTEQDKATDSSLNIEPKPVPKEPVSEIASTSSPERINIENSDVGFLPSGTAVIEKPFSIQIADSLFSGREAIRVSAPSTYYSIELYIRSELAIEARYLGLMNKEFDRWIYSFDTSNIPNGAYEIFARAKSTEGLHTSESVIVRVKNEIVAVEPTRVTPSLTSTSSEIQRNFYLYEASQDSEAITTTLSQVVASEVKSILNEEETNFNDLLQRYAVAKLTGNEAVIEAVNREFSEQKEKLVTQALLNNETKDIASQIGVALEERIKDMQVRVDTFENIRASREKKLVSTDSDNDGISDYDETTVYKTDPNNPDSDLDGFIDGAEIARGFDPLDSKPEIVVDYELPNETIGLVRPDALKITDVSPFVQLNNDDSRLVLTDISGKGLPNTFATIYIFSTPTIVTVKTTDDGSFTYRFDKELEDGSHEVYVAFTDNAGAILAHSEPFQFVKQAEAFSPVGADNESVVITAPSVVETSTINAIRLVLAMAIVVLGFMLLMLGISLRSGTASPKKRRHLLRV